MNIRGKVVCEDQVPVGEAEVKALVKDVLAGSAYTHAKEGTFYLAYDRNAFGDTFQIEITREGFRPYKRQHTLPKGDQEYALQSIVLEKNVVILAGRVIDRAGNGIWGAKVSIFDGSARIGNEVECDAVGRFETTISCKYVGNVLTVRAGRNDMSSAQKVRLPKEGVRDLVIHLTRTPWKPILAGLAVLFVLILLIRLCNSGTNSNNSNTNTTSTSNTISTSAGGHKPSQMPKVIGQTLDRVSNVAKQLKVVISEIAYTTNGTSEAGRVVAQFPEEGSPIDVNTPIFIQVMAAKNLMTAVPNVKSKKVEDAIKIIEESHLTVSVIFVPEKTGKNFGLVTKQDPNPKRDLLGLLVKNVFEGSTVSIEVGSKSDERPSIPSNYHFITVKDR